MKIDGGCRDVVFVHPAEKPENSGTIILLVAIPETMVILGFVIAVVMMFTQ